MIDINQILKELYEIDPSLRLQEERVKKIIAEMLDSKPDTKFNLDFAKILKQKLLSQIDSSKITKLNIINSIFMNPKFRFFGLGVVAVILIIVGYSLPRKGGILPINSTKDVIETQKDLILKARAEVKKFTSKEEFLAYLENAQSIGGGFGRGGEIQRAMPMSESAGIAQSDSLNSLSPANEKSLPQSAPSRVSDTNVQVKGIDEPDIVKTNGKEIFVSTQNLYLYNRPIIMEDMPLDSQFKIMPPQYPTQETKVINALPIDKIKQIGKIPKQGEMLLIGNNLLVFTYQGVYAFDITDPQNPKDIWKIDYENNGNLVTARLMDGKVYFVLQKYLDFQSPCPMDLLKLSMAQSVETKTVSIACTDIYHPLVPIGDTTTYHAFRINPGTGEIEKNISFVGSSGQTIVYMSADSLYISYVFNEDQIKILADFLKTNGQGLLPEAVIEKVNKLLAYDISSGAKQLELSNILQKFYAGLNQDDRRKLENDMENKLSEYVKMHMRELTSTGLVKIALKDFAITATGKVPGMPLNQFSLDEYKGNLRVATTVSGQGTIWGGWRGDASANDVYVLNGGLEVIGSIKDLGLTERIFSARFVGERGFLVTFRQTDPFYVLDLSNPKAPKMSGELKIPGFSSYLHPLKENLILGVGQENGRVKLSLFDVSDSFNPKEIDKYSLDEYWSEAQNNHHAFLQDEKHEVFFLPGGQTGYVFSYKNNKLSLEKAVGKIQAQRALYINDYLYIVGSDRIVVIHEKNWERAGELIY